MPFASVLPPEAGEPVAVALLDRIAVPLRPAASSPASGPGGDLLNHLASGTPLEPAGDPEALLAEGRAWPEADVTFLAPIARPGKIIAAGLNYRDHCREIGMPEPESPLVFAKYPSSVVGPGDPIRLPPTAATQVDFEAELGMVIGTRARDVGADAALDHVAGYVAANDVSARDVQAAEAQWTRAKSFDSFCPVGPWMASPGEVGDPQRLAIRLDLGDQTMQDSSTSEMIFSCAELVSFLSRSTTLEPGDLILTGTPPGVGMGRTPPRYLADGDRVTVTIDGLGSLTNPVGEER